MCKLKWLKGINTFVCTSYMNEITKATCMMVWTWENKSRHHDFSSGKHTMQNAARCRDMVQHPCLYDSCTANASL